MPLNSDIYDMPGGSKVGMKGKLTLFIWRLQRKDPSGLEKSSGRIRLSVTATQR
jgi:hypothetical protein